VRASLTFRAVVDLLADAFDCEDVEWLAQLPFTICLPRWNAVVVHAGLAPGVPLEGQDGAHMTRMRDLRSTEAAAGDAGEGGSEAAGDDGGAVAAGSWTVLEKPARGSVAWASVWAGPEHVVFGHDAKRGLQQHAHATGLDTNCCKGGVLSALVLTGGGGGGGGGGGWGVGGALTGAQPVGRRTVQVASRQIRDSNPQLC
jgi:hypothetical protein